MDSGFKFVICGGLGFIVYTLILMLGALDKQANALTHIAQRLNDIRLALEEWQKP